MNAFKPLPEITAVMIDEVPRLVDSKGNDVTLTMQGCERLADCWNATRKFYAPAAHTTASVTIRVTSAFSEETGFQSVVAEVLK